MFYRECHREPIDRALSRFSEDRTAMLPAWHYDALFVVLSEMPSESGMDVVRKIHDKSG